MIPYRHLSNVYDAFMRDAPHEDWLHWIQQNIVNVENLEAADVGCGTGVFTVQMAHMCNRVFGVDVSEEMLTQAQHRAMDAGVHVQWLCQDATAFRLPQSVQLITSTCDVVNYLLTNEHLAGFFHQVWGGLESGGWFCFDALGPKRIEALHHGHWYDIQDDAAILFETDVEESTGRIHYDVCMFVTDDGDCYRRHDEQHQQQYHDATLLKELAEQQGFLVNHIIGDFGRSETSEADRLCFILQKRDG